MDDQSIDVSSMRINYAKAELHESDLAESPLDQFKQWLREAVECGTDAIPEPNAMVLSTVNGAGEVHSRSVLLKGIDQRGLIFFTNYQSAKAHDIEVNNNVSVLFPWYPMHRQVIVTGTVQKISEQESIDYFSTRPYKSKLGALISQQSQIISGRDVIEQTMDELIAKFPEGEHVPMPAHWGGYLIQVHSMEFWQGRRSRLHDRLKYISLGNGTSIADKNNWQVVRLSP